MFVAKDAFSNLFYLVMSFKNNCAGTGVGLKSFGKAVTKGTKKIGRTLTTIADSPDKRAQERVAKVVTPKAKKRRQRKGNVKHMRSAQNESLGLDIGKFTNVFRSIMTNFV